jgi:serine/threonine protein kinase
MGTDIIHGDIKPQNVLVFKGTTGKTTVRVTDFGYSTLSESKAGKVYLPKSRPWNAPEHHFGEFTAPDAKQTDVYSFGMLCLWVLFGGAPRLQCSTIYTFDASTGLRTSLEKFKYDDKLEHIAYQLIDTIPLVGMNAEHRNRLKEFFGLTVPLNPAKRASDLQKLVILLRQEQ